MVMPVGLEGALLVIASFLQLCSLLGRGPGVLEPSHWLSAGGSLP